MNLLYAAVLALIAIVLLTVSLSRLRGTQTKADYLVAGRSLPAVVLVFTLLSSWIGSGSLLGGAENAYKHGMAALWQGGGGWAGLLLIYFIAPRARKFAQFTIPDLLEARYNQTARVLGVIAILFAYTAITSYQLIGGGDILHLVFPDTISADMGKYIMAAFVISFTAIAGMASVAYMDVFIGVLATVTLIAALPFVLHGAGGWSVVHASLPATHFQVLGDFTLLQALELFIPTMLLMLGNQSMYQKFFSARSERDARNAVVGWIIGTVILETIIIVLAVTASVLFPTGEVHQRPREISGVDGAAWSARVAGCAADGCDLRKDYFDSEQLSVFTGDESCERCVLALYRAEGERQDGAAGVALHGVAAGYLGVVPGAEYQLGAGEDPVCVHGVFGCADAGDPGCVLLETGEWGRSGFCDCCGNGGDSVLGYGCGEASSAGDAGAARCNLPCPAGRAGMPGGGEPGDAAAFARAAAAVFVSLH